MPEHTVAECRAALAFADRALAQAQTVRDPVPSSVAYWASQSRYWQGQLARLGALTPGAITPLPPPKPEKLHATRQEFDELYCVRCKRRWDIKEEEPSECLTR